MLMVGNSENELGHNEGVLEEILQATNGARFEMVDQEEFRDVLTLVMVKGGNAPGRSFSPAGNFAPVLSGIFPSRRNMVKTMEDMEAIKKTHMESGLLVDDMGEGLWGPLLIDHGHLEYYENETMYDPTVPESVNAIEHVMDEANRYSLDNKLSVPGWCILEGALAKGENVHDMIAPHMNSDSRGWLKKFKAAFDPNSTSDAAYHIEGGDHGRES